MFGAPAPASAPASENAAAPASAAAPESAAPTGRDAEILSGAPLMRTDVKAEVESDKTEVGGTLLLRFQGAYVTDTDAADQPLSAPNLLDVYLDARPSERVRAFVQGRINYDATAENGRADIPDYCTSTTPGSQNEKDCDSGRDLLAKAFATPATSAELAQLWLKFDIERAVYVTLGKQPIKWGAAHLWNPTDFLNRQSRDPLSQIDLRTGASLVKIHIPWESQTANFYAIALLDESRRVGDVGAAARAEIGFGTTELSLSAAARRDKPLSLGGDFSTGLGAFDLYAEGAVSHGNHVPLAGQPDRSDDWIPWVSGGVGWSIDYGDSDTATWGVEYAYNNDGVSKRSLVVPALTAGRSLFSLPRQAVGTYLLLMAPGTWNNSSIFVTGLVDLDDRSGTARFQWSQNVLTYLSVQPYVGAYFGEKGDLFRLNINAASTTRAPAYLTADAGVWLQVKL